MVLPRKQVADFQFTVIWSKGHRMLFFTLVLMVYTADTVYNLQAIIHVVLRR